jgi:uncharacterized membrane protein YdfJ with MMPL/SSD domain
LAALARTEERALVFAWFLSPAILDSGALVVCGVACVDLALFGRVTSVGAGIPAIEVVWEASVASVPTAITTFLGVGDTHVDVVVTISPSRGRHTSCQGDHYANCVLHKLFPVLIVFAH